MFQRPAAKGSPAAPGADADAAEASAEELIAEEIQGLLDSAAEDESTAPDEVADDAGASDPTIDEIDRMLADEAEQDEELIGDFQSVQDVAAGVKPEGPGQRLSDHGPSERDGSASAVADELDNQPEHAEPDTFEPNPEAEGAAAPGWFDRMRGMPWRGVGEKVEKVALAACGVMNWPVRRLLAPEWRSYVGVIALLNVFVGIAAFVVGLVRFVL
jgi:hypothetical protein